MSDRRGIPAASSPAALARMQRQARRDTVPELALRRLLHAAGLRYRVDHRALAGIRRRADVAFTRAKVAVFVDGCFWHCCPVHGTRPKNNEQWWAEKLERNVARDRETDEQLALAGWLVIRVWEHEDPQAAAARVAAAVASRSVFRRPGISASRPVGT